jgi:pyrroloquinoline quinone (PQQ) biosynthesis protein C
MRPLLRAVGGRFTRFPRADVLYREYLATSHAVVRASVPLMEAARARAEAMADDPVASRLVGYFEEHVIEELDHDEWLLEDLAAVGGDRAAVLDQVPSPRVATLVGAQYYWIRHRHPVALLGYMAVLEGYPPTVGMIDRFAERTGFDRRAFRTLYEHADLDQGHGDEIFELLDELPLGPDLTRLLGLSGMHTMANVAAVLDEVVDRCANRSG